MLLFHRKISAAKERQRKRLSKRWGTIYLHGKLDEIQNDLGIIPSDIPEKEMLRYVNNIYTIDGIIPKHPNRIYPVYVTTADGVSHKANLYYWEHVKRDEHKWWDGTVYYTTFKIRKGLIVAEGDTEAEEFALKRYNERVKYI